METTAIDGGALILGLSVLLFIGVVIAALVNGMRMNMLDRKMSGGRAKPGDRASARIMVRTAEPVSIDE